MMGEFIAVALSVLTVLCIWCVLGDRGRYEAARLQHVGTN